LKQTKKKPHLLTESEYWKGFRDGQINGKKEATIEIANILANLDNEKGIGKKTMEKIMIAIAKEVGRFK
jgi:hypothetical protein